MYVEFQSDKSKQRLLLDVVEDGNLSNYAVVDNTFTEKGTPSNKQRHFYAFPDYDVKKGDAIVLYTKSGSLAPTFRNEATETKYHYFFWGVDHSIWNSDDTAHLLQLVDFSNKQV